VPALVKWTKASAWASFSTVAITARIWLPVVRADGDRVCSRTGAA
jgi:hypothetical protein